MATPRKKTAASVRRPRRQAAANAAVDTTPSLPPEPAGPAPQAEASAEPAAASPPPAEGAPAADSGPLFIVGIGASAGGLDALGKFFAATRRSPLVSYIVVQHLSPDHRSFMVELLSRHTTIPVQRAEDGLLVEPDRIYLIPPGRNLKIFQRRLLLEEQDSPRSINLPIDIFLRSLAEDQGRRSVGIVLSGTGSDGTLGVRAVKAAGGLVLVQSEDSAQFDGMPRSAIGTGLADFVGPPEQLPGHLQRCIEHPMLVQEEARLREPSANESLLLKLFLILKKRCGVDFSHYKPSTIDRRIERRMGIHQLTSLADYVRYLDSSPTEAELLFNEMLIHVTRFFRDSEVWETLSAQVVPAIIERAAPADSIRVWVPGCATGEEAYSLAILFSEALAARQRTNEVKIFATDISPLSLDVASRAMYTDSEVADITVDRLNRHFNRQGPLWVLRPHLRKMVIYARHDILKDPPFAKLDLVSCRNLLIYFQPALQARVVALFRFALRPDGYLLLGTSESVGEQRESFRVLSSKHALFQPRNDGGGPRLPPLAEARTALAAHDISSVEPLPGPRPAPFPRVSRDGLSLEAVYREILNDYAPAAVIIDDSLEVLHLVGKAGDYLRHPPGQFTNNLLKLTSHSLATPLTTALHRVRKDGLADFTLDNIRCRDGAKTHLVRLRIKSFGADRRGRPIRLVLIEEKKATPGTHSSRVEDYRVDQSALQRIAALEHELTYTKESLQATVEELEASNEELQATNEELLAANEELQSTNEELQSVNEELHTVNAENQGRIDELTRLSNDISNLLTAASIGMVMLDRSLRIRRSSAGLEPLLRLSGQDAGAPLEIIARQLRFPELVAMAEEVAQNGKPLEREILAPSDHFVLLRCLPYRSETESIDGVVLTLIDITSRKSLELEAARGSALLQSILDSIPANLVVLDERGHIVHVNQRWARFASDNGQPPDGRVGAGVNYLHVCHKAAAHGAEEASSVIAGLRSILEGRLSEYTIEYPCHSPAEQRWFRLHAVRINAPTRGVLVAHFDISELRRPRVVSAAPAESPRPNTSHL